MKPPTALLAVMGKEVRQILRDKRMAALLVIAPVIQLVVLGHAVNLDVVHVPTVIADRDLTPESRRLVAGVTAGDTLKVVAATDREREAEDAIVEGRAAVALIVPRGFASKASRGQRATVQALTDGSDSNRATIAQSAISAYVFRASMAALRERATLAKGLAAAAAASSGDASAANATIGSAPLRTFAIEPRIFYNPALDSSFYFVPGVAATLLLIVAMVVMAMGLAREKEMGTLEQVLVTPIRPFTLIMGKTLPLGIIGLLDLTLVLIAAMILFHVPLRGDLLVIYTGGALYLLALLGLGLFLSALAKNQQQAFFLAMFIILPAILLSGFITPVANMPEVLQPLTYVNPVRHFVEILRAVMLEGAGFSDVLPQLVALAGIGVVIFGAATLTVSRKLA